MLRRRLLLGRGLVLLECRRLLLWLVSLLWPSLWLVSLLWLSLRRVSLLWLSLRRGCLLLGRGLVRLFPDRRLLLGRGRLLLRRVSLLRLAAGL
uniref:hypothetical protein n=1 Tax=Halosimplex amylolyticum TaxID=3396616 RepID=UPI003F54F207